MNREINCSFLCTEDPQCPGHSWAPNSTWPSLLRGLPLKVDQLSNLISTVMVRRWDQSELGLGTCPLQRDPPLTTCPFPYPLLVLCKIPDLQDRRVFLPPEDLWTCLMLLESWHWDLPFVILPHVPKQTIWCSVFIKQMTICLERRRVLSSSHTLGDWVKVHIFSRLT